MVQILGSLTAREYHTTCIWPELNFPNDRSYELVLLGWQADWPSRAGRIYSTDGIKWSVDRSALMHDLGVAGGVEDHMIYRPYIVDVDGTPWLYYNTKVLLSF